MRAQREAVQAMHAATDPAWMELDLTMGQMKALFVLFDDTALTVGALATRLGLGKPAASILVERLVQLEFVTRTEDSLDRRRTLVRLTPKGEDLIGQIRQGGHDQLRALLGLLSPEDLSALCQGLQALGNVAAGQTREVAALS
jgi:DNA-binding MarR family transcriptional regulator